MKPTSGCILVVDDDRHVRTIVNLRLRAAGYDVFESENGQGALDRVREGGIDIIVLDALMPEMDGFEVLKQLHSFENRPSVIFLTAMDENDSRVRGYGDTIDFIGKPFEAEDFLARIAEAFRKHRVIQGARAQRETPLDAAPEMKIASPHHLVRGMLDDMKSACAALAVAQRENDRDAMVALGHTIKGTSGVFGFMAISDLGGQIERSAQAQAKDQDLTRSHIHSLSLLIDDELAKETGFESSAGSSTDQSRVMPHIERTPRTPTLLP